MIRYLLLVSPAANRVYSAEAPRLGCAELEICLPHLRDVAPVQLCGVDYIGFSADQPLSDAELEVVARLSVSLALFRVHEGQGERDGACDGQCDSEGAGERDSQGNNGCGSDRDKGLGNRQLALVPVELPALTWVDDDIVTIPKYPGKTNERLTQLLLNVTLAAAAERRRIRPARVLDPMCGRGTSLAVAWRLGHHGFGIEVDPASITGAERFYKTYLRTKRYRHQARRAPLRRDGRNLGTKLAITFTPTPAPGRGSSDPLVMEIVPGDGRDAAALWGKKTFDVIITDAPYGVVHGASRPGGQRPRARKPGDLLAEAIPVWTRILRPGGALGLSWNTKTLSRADLVEMVTAAGLLPCLDGPWLDLAHQVDSSITRDLVIAVKPLTPALNTPKLTPEPTAGFTPAPTPKSTPESTPGSTSTSPKESR